MRKILFIFIISIGLILRIYPFLNQEFSFDERFTYYFASRVNFIEQIVKPADDRPPLYYLLEKIILKFSDNYLALRMPSLIFSILSMILIYKIFELFLKKASLFALALSAVNPLLIHVGWQARDYSLLFFLVVLTIYLIIKTNLISECEKKPLVYIKKMLPLLITILLGILTSYLYYTFIFTVIASLIITTILVNKNKMKYKIRCLLKFIYLLIPIILIAAFYLKTNTNNIISRNQSPVEESETIRQTISDLFSFNLYYWRTEDFKLPLFLTIVLLLFPIFYLFKEEQKKEITFTISFFYIQTILCAIVYAVISKFYLSLFLTRGLLPFAVFQIFLATFFIYEIISKNKLKPTQKAFKILIFYIIFMVGIMQFLVRYRFIEPARKSTRDWAYPVAEDKPLTVLTNFVYSKMNDDTALLIWPRYNELIFGYECKNKCENDLKFNNYFHNEYENNTNKIDDIVLNYERPLSNLIIVYDKYVYENIIGGVNLQLNDFIKKDCLKTTTTDIGFYYRVVKCKLR